MKTIGIYRITCTVNGKVYIGSSENVGHRLVAHRSMLRHQTHSSRAMQRAWDKHGPAVFTFEVIEICAQVDLLVREQHHIDSHRAAESRFGFNGCPVAGTRKGSPQPPSVAETMRRVHTGKPKSPEHRAKIAAAHLGRPKHTEESRARLREIAAAQYADPDARRRAGEFGRLSRGGRGKQP